MLVPVGLIILRSKERWCDVAGLLALLEVDDVGQGRLYRHYCGSVLESKKSDKQYDSCALIGCNAGIDFSNHEDIYHGPSVDQWQVLFVGRDESRIVLSGEESSDASSRRYSCCLRYLVGCWIIDRGVVICGFASLGLWGHFRFAMCFLLGVTIHGGDGIAEFRSYLPTFGYVLAINQLREIDAIDGDRSMAFVMYYGLNGIFKTQDQMGLVSVGWWWLMSSVDKFLGYLWFSVVSDITLKMGGVLVLIGSLYGFEKMFKHRPNGGGSHNRCSWGPRIQMLAVIYLCYVYDCCHK
ncbi:hypothetical protein F2Q68_00005149 [Brassica cretica]|uniref:Uncharacterized protein n=1 Tax=Brassica cretica TaxID=69181 RepID=A0A8S9JHG5_BRACR|nr:hypothetical protein F2Q68_00005149 [Brassica cretica]